MTYFPFDVTQLESLNEQDKKEALLAAKTAEEVARYYQDLAVAIIDDETDGSHIPSPQLQPAQMMLASEATSILQTNGKVQGSTAARAGFKLFMATQMDFYRSSPQYLEALDINGNPSKAESLFKALQYMHHILEDTYAPIDEYFEDAFRTMEQWITREQAQEGSMKPTLKPDFNAGKKPDNDNDPDNKPDNGSKFQAPSPFAPFRGFRP